MKKNECKHVQILERKLRSNQFTLAVIGLGYVGLPLAVEFAKKGVQVVGIDIDKRKVDHINKGRSYIQDVPTRDVDEVVRKGSLKASTQFNALQKTDAVIVCVPTPLNRVRDPDISYIVDAANEIAKHLHRGELVVLESTTYPGTTEEVILPKLEQNGFKAGKDFFLCFSPERIDPGNKKFSTASIPKVVGGITSSCTQLGSLLYGCVFSKVFTVSSARTAEMTKLLENTFRIVNIGLINELAMAAGSLGVNMWEAIEAASTKPFGFMPFYPGPGVGGHCIGIDPIYLSWKAKAFGLQLRFIELAREVNINMPRYVVQRIQYLLTQKQKKLIHGSNIFVIGVTYKKDVEDTRESPAFEVIEQLLELGANVSYHDPYVPEIVIHSHHLHSKSLNAKELSNQDLVVILTDHSSLDYSTMIKKSKLIFDTRNVLKKFSSNKIIKL